MKKVLIALFVACFAMPVNADTLQGCFDMEYIADMEYYGEITSKETPQGLIVYDKENREYIILEETETEICFALVQKET